MERQSQRNAEGDILMKEADKLTTKTLLRWKADYDTAGPIYERAGTAYKNAQNYLGAKNAFKKAAECLKQADLSFLAAKNYESAAMMAKEMSQTDESVSLIEESAKHFRLTGNPDKAAEVLIKAARWIESSDVEKALSLAKTSLEVYEIDDKEQFSGNAYKYATGLCIRNKRIDDALQMYNKQAAIHSKLNHDSDVLKAYLSIMIIHLSRDDYAAAEKAFQDFVGTHGFTNSQEGRGAMELMDAYEKRDNEGLKKCVNKQIFTFLDNDVAKLAKKLTASGAPSSSSKEDDQGLA
jgi:tetratricopeptide (TPR) repeat protein